MINRANISAYALYTNFGIGDESDGFRLTIGTMSGSVAFDALRLHDGMKFTTRDRDNDFKVNTNCAVSARGAWWYDACYDSNLNGMYGVGDGRGLMWKNYLNDIIMKDTTMKLKCA
ncbi:hypothetical protein FSP39_001368 [Pinctada imbricata]|uniref:Fibrinogen C-terminal domain-containing protein n=1 Tax=Pinctada imbricata TaxID=66713 RepID=A0AA88YA47_PINIB|nr:hypothetical protein FSP39_001368 [Pinctada imbricata]